MMVQNLMTKLLSQISTCQRCGLWKTKTNYVIGEGSETARIMLIGEAPGYHEDKQGRPFVGRAGKILDELIASIGFTRQDIFITNILKCRPPNNRNPDSSEIRQCTEYLDRQIDIIQPKILAPLGKYACQYLFEKFGLCFDSISKIHGKIFKKVTLRGTIYLLPLYHPAVATYNPTRKTELLEDFKKIQTVLDERNC